VQLCESARRECDGLFLFLQEYQAHAVTESECFTKVRWHSPLAMSHSFTCAFARIAADSFITTYAFARCEFHISEHIPSMLYVSVMHRVWMCMLVCDSVRVSVGVLSEAMR
jgi:hypothetical protein